MSSSTLADSRVPTFIQYDSNGETKNSKRKRAPVASKNPKTKRSKKDRVTPANGVEDNSVDIWVGVLVENNLGAYSVYFGENDNRNTTNVFQIEDVLQDKDYASVLGTLKALELSLQIEAPINLYTSCRELPRVSVGKRGLVHYPELIGKVKELIAEKAEGVSVLYLSGRTPSPELGASVELATTALKNQLKGADAKKDERPVTHETLSQEVSLEDMVVETTTAEEVKDTKKEVPADEAIVEDKTKETEETIFENNTDFENHVEQEVVIEEEEVEKTKETTVIENVDINNNKVNGVEKQIETVEENKMSVDETIVEAPVVAEVAAATETTEAPTTTITKVTTTVVKETFEVISEPIDTVMREASTISTSDMDEDSSNGNSQNDDLIEEDEAKPSSWSLGIRNVWDLLTSPFKSHK